MDTYTLCSDDDIILDHEDDTNNFIIKFNVIETFSNIKEIINENMFFYLIKELNDSIILNYNETTNEDTNSVIFKIQTPNEASFKKIFDGYFNLYINYGKNVTNDKVTMFGIKHTNLNSLSKNDIYFEKMNITIGSNEQNGSNIEFHFSLDDGVDIVMNKIVALYIKKIIKKIKIYFDK